MSTDKTAKRVVTPEFRLAFPNLFKAASAFEGTEAKYSAVLLFQKAKDAKSLIPDWAKPAIMAAATDKWGPKDKWPKGMKLPFRDGNEKSLDGYKDAVFCTATSKERPGLVDQGLHPVVEEDRTIYAGCYCRAELMAFAYDMAGNRGVAFGLQNIQKLRDGEPFSGRKRAQDVFDKVEDSSQDANSYPTEVTVDELDDTF